MSFLIAVLTLVLSFIAILVVARSKSAGISLKVLNFLFSLSLILLVYYCGGWIYISYYLRFVVLAVFILASLSSLRRPTFVTQKKATIILKILTIAISGTVIFFYFSSRNYPEPSVNLSFPFKNGSFCIMQGGSNSVINVFHSGQNRAVYAFDIVKLSKAGCRSGTLFPSALQDYVTYGEKIYSPVDGKIVAMDNNVTDNTPPLENKTEKAGCYVVIQKENTFILLAHFRTNSISVNKSDSVKTGDYLGEAGNSGNSIEPHLHIEAHTNNNGITSPVSIKFDGENYTYNDLILR